MVTVTHCTMPKVLVQSRELSELTSCELVGAIVEESLYGTASCALILRDPKGAVPGELGHHTLGAQLKASVVIPDSTNAVELFTGQITGLERRRGESGSVTVVHGEDPSHRLRRGTRIAVRRGSPDAIAKDIAGAAGIPVGTVESVGHEYSRLTQHDESDWEFLCRLGHENGRVVYMRVGKLCFRAIGGRTQQTLSYGDHLVSVSALASLGRRPDRVQVRDWDPDGAQERLSETGVPNLPAPFAGSESQGGGNSVALYHPAAVMDPKHMAESAEALAAEYAAEGISIRAEAKGNPSLRAGTRVRFDGVGAGFDADYTITGVRHEFGSDRGYRTDIQVRDSARIAQPMAERTAPRMPALVCGVVSSIKDPDGEGRVEVTFPGLDGQYVSAWARVVYPGGVGGGMYASPEVKEEVLVGCDQGRIDRLFVIGGLYSKQRTPCAHRADPLYDETKGTTRTRSVVSCSGQRLELIDGAQKQGVVIASGNGELSIELLQSETKVLVRSGGDVEISGTGKVAVKGCGVSIDAGTGDLDLVGRAVTLAANTGSVSVSGQTGLSLTSNGNTELKGLFVRIN